MLPAARGPTAYCLLTQAPDPRRRSRRRPLVLVGWRARALCTPTDRWPSRRPSHGTLDGTRRSPPDRRGCGVPAPAICLGDAAVKDRHVVSVLRERAHEAGTDEARATDHQNAHRDIVE